MPEGSGVFNVLKKNKKVLLASISGSAIEWFDYFLYGTFAALIFNKLFFPMVNPTVGLLLSYLSFSLTFLIRPIGGVIFASIGDRLGRKKTLVITLSLMGTATVLMGLLPTYDKIGIWSPLLLIFLRIIQGMGIGGEWGGTLLLAYEYAPKERKGFFSSIPQAGVTIGMLLATLAISLMLTAGEDDFLAWGWRVPFLLSSILVCIGLWVRKDIEETPAFLKEKAAGKIAKSPLKQTIKYYWREVLIAAGLKAISTTAFYMFSIFIVSYAVTNLSYPKNVVLQAVAVSSLIATVMIPLTGYISDLIGRVKVYVIGTTLIGAFIVPWFLILQTQNSLALLMGTVIAFGLLWPLVNAVLGTLLADIFTTQVRYTGITLGYQIGATIVGGTAPLIATGLLTYYAGNWLPVAFYFIVISSISLVAISVAVQHQAKC